MTSHIPHYRGDHHVLGDRAQAGQGGAVRATAAGVQAAPVHGAFAFPAARGTQHAQPRRRSSEHRWGCGSSPAGASLGSQAGAVHSHIEPPPPPPPDARAGACRRRWISRRRRASACASCAVPGLKRAKVTTSPAQCRSLRPAALSHSYSAEARGGSRGAEPEQELIICSLVEGRQETVSVDLVFR